MSVVASGLHLAHQTLRTRAHVSTILNAQLTMLSVRLAYQAKYRSRTGVRRVIGKVLKRKAKRYVNGANSENDDTVVLV